MNILIKILQIFGLTLIGFIVYEIILRFNLNFDLFDKKRNIKQEFIFHSSILVMLIVFFFIGNIIIKIIQEGIRCIIVL